MIEPVIVDGETTYELLAAKQTIESMSLIYV